MGRPWALGGSQARPINRGLRSGLRASRWPASLCLHRWRQAPDARSGSMAVLSTLWMALVLLGALGGPQTAAEAQVSAQPHFQQDKVRCSPARCPGWEGAALWGGAVSLGTGELSKAAN